jgi:hypothetical protein
VKCSILDGRGLQGDAGARGLDSHRGEKTLLPSVVIYSGGGMHLYHLLDSPVDAHDKRVEGILKGLAKLYKGDPAAAEVARILRLPGTRNLKPGYAPRKPKITIRWQHWDRVYRLDDFTELAPSRRRNGTKPGSTATIREGERHTFICREAGGCVRRDGRPML